MDQRLMLALDGMKLTIFYAGCEAVFDGTTVIREIVLLNGIRDKCRKFKDSDEWYV